MRNKNLQNIWQLPGGGKKKQVWYERSGVGHLLTAGVRRRGKYGQSSVATTSSLFLHGTVLGEHRCNEAPLAPVGEKMLREIIILCYYFPFQKPLKACWRMMDNELGHATMRTTLFSPQKEGKKKTARSSL